MACHHSAKPPTSRLGVPSGPRGSRHLLPGAGIDCQRAYEGFRCAPQSFIYTLLSQITVESGLPHSMPPLFAHKNQRKHGQRHCKVDKRKSDPRVLEANLCAELDCVEADAKAEYLAAEVEKGADFRCLLSVALQSMSATTAEREWIRKGEEAHLGGISIHNRCRNLQPKTRNCNPKARTNRVQLMLQAYALNDDAQG